MTELRWTDPGLHVADDALRAIDQRSLERQHRGWRVRYCILGEAPTKAELLDGLADALEFPRWFGRNWDALADCLGDLDMPTVLVIDGTARLQRDVRDTLVELLARAAVDSAATPAPLSVVLSGGRSGAGNLR